MNDQIQQSRTLLDAIADTAAKRKEFPIGSGCLDYFRDALLAVSHVSFRGNQQHNPGQELHWARGKSTDEADAIERHYVCRGTVDDDGIPHTWKLAWRALALLQKELEAQFQLTLPRGCRAPGTEKASIAQDPTGNVGGKQADCVSNRPGISADVANIR